MINREMLELAAKAAGLRVLAHLDSKGEWVDGYSEMYLVNERGYPIRKWNPRDDDGDAFRLAVTLGIQPCWHQRLGLASAQLVPTNPSLDVVNIQEYGSDPRAATRHAITRAAAEIGKGMK